MNGFGETPLRGGLTAAVRPYRLMSGGHLRFAGTGWSECQSRTGSPAGDDRDYGATIMNTRNSRSCRAGFGRRVINPARGISLAGYFNPRPNTGVLDDLQVKVLLIECGGTVVGLIAYDLLIVPLLLISKVRAALKRAKGIPSRRRFRCARRTRTPGRTWARSSIWPSATRRTWISPLSRLRRRSRRRRRTWRRRRSPPAAWRTIPSLSTAATG